MWGQDKLPKIAISQSFDEILTSGFDAFDSNTQEAWCAEIT
jgi:hypothetical protein